MREYWLWQTFEWSMTYTTIWLKNRLRHTRFDLFSLITLSDEEAIAIKDMLKQDPEKWTKIVRDIIMSQWNAHIPQ